MKASRIAHLGAIAGLVSAGFFASAAADGGTLVINSYTADPAPRAAFTAMVEQFEAENPDISVEVNITDIEAFNTAIRNFLTANPPDVVTWYAGERMRTFVERDLFTDVTHIWENLDLYTDMDSALSALTVDDRQWGVPISYYQWGLYYRSDVLEDNGVAVPRTWDDFIEACGTLREAGVAPVTIGTRYLWPVAGWFDLLNLRINGLDFHIELAAGRIPYTDERIHAVFDHWEDALEADCFIDDHAGYSWQEAQPFLFQGDAAMYLMGNFLTANFTDELHEVMEFAPFPVIDPDMPRYEEAPTDTLHIPAGAENPEAAARFLAFAVRPDVQTEYNAGLNQLAPHGLASVPDDKFLSEGFLMLREAEGLSQFYDRDTTPEMAQAGMEGFQEFMVHPDRRDAILQRLEQQRQRIFGEN